MALDMSKFIARFIEEARDLIQKINEGIVLIEKNPADEETINSVFRAAHTIKGSSRMMKYTRISEVAHRMEDVLGAVREKTIPFTKDLGDIIFRGVDAVSSMVEQIAAGTVVETDNTALCEELKAASEGKVPASAATPLPQTAGQEPEISEQKPETSEQKPLLSEPDRSAVEPAMAAPSQPAQAERPVEHKAHAAADTIRVNTEKLDELIKLMGEIISNQGRLKYRLQELREIERTIRRMTETIGKILPYLPELPESAAKQDLQSIAADLHRGSVTLKQRTGQVVFGFKDDISVNEFLNNELQERAMMLRMVPLSLVFDTLHRIPRDLARALGKDVDLFIEGGEIELDKKIVEKISDPLVHMIRNAIDHGIESPEDRVKAGKPQCGRLVLSAICEGGHAVIRMTDDGRGLNLQKIREKALKRKMLSEEKLASMSEAEITNLIFAPGFSTNEIITDVSGRGVGMDVVKKNVVEDLKGSITVSSEEGKGISFTMRLPLSLAIVRILMLGAGETTIAIPTHYIEEIRDIEEGALIDVVNKKAIRVRSELIPVVHIESLLDMPVQTQGSDSKITVIVAMGGEKLGLIADRLVDEKDVVIKPLPRHLKTVKKVSGVIIAANNEIINVLHVPALLESSKNIRETHAGPGASAGSAERKPVHILVVDDSINTREIEKSILEAYGYRVTVAEDGMDAIEKAAETKFDLVVTDVDMPRMDGFSLTKKLRDDDLYRSTPIIIVTSREKEEDKRRGIQVGADAYIIKGAFDQGSLIDTIRNLAG